MTFNRASGLIIHSTDMVDDWLQHLNSGRLTGVAFIDLSKAFDTINHEILLSKFHDIGSNELCIKWFRSYLSGRTQKDQFNVATSNALPVNTGIRQGSILGPLLFLIFINNMPNVISHGKMCMYADDTYYFIYMLVVQM